MDQILKKRVISAGIVATVFTASFSGVYITGEKTVEKEVSTQLNDSYMTQVSSKVKTDVYDEMDGYIANYITNNNISQYFNEQTINQLSENVVQTIEAEDSTITMNLTDQQKTEVQEMVQTAITSAISNYDKDNQAKITQAMMLSEEEKSFISSTVTESVAEQIQNQAFIPDEEGKITVSEEQLDKKISDSVTEILKDINLNESSVIESVSISDEDKESIKKEVKDSIDLTPYVTKDVLDNAGYLTEDELQDQISNATDVAVNLALEEMNQTIEDKIIANTPQKGVDYFTEDEINDLKSNITESVLQSIDDIIDDLETQITANKTEIDAIEQTIEALQTSLSSTESSLNELIADYDTNKTKIEELTSQAVELKESIDTLREKVNALESNKLNISTFTEYKTNNDNKVKDLSDNYTTLKQNYDEFVVSTNNTINSIEEKINDLESVEQVSVSDYQMLKSSFETFKSDTETTLSNLNTSIEVLGNDKLDIDDFNTVKTDIQNNINEITDTIGSIDFTTESYATITDAIVSLQSQLDSFHSDYDDVILTANAEIESLKASVGSKPDALESYQGSLWEKAADLQTTLNTKASLSEVQSISNDLDDYKELIATEIQQLQNSIDGISTELDTKLDTSDFNAYCITANASITALETNVSSLAATFGIVKDNQGSKYKEDTSYNSGDYVLHNDTLYKCKKTTTGTFNASDWEKTTFTKEIGTMSSSLLSESDARLQADNDLSQALSQETTERKAADDNIIEILSKISSNEAAEYNKSALYSVGDYAIYEDELYICKTNITSPETFNANKWIKTSIANELGRVATAEEKITSLEAEVEILNNSIIPDVKKSIANEYDSTHSYAVGDYCYHDNVLYKCLIKSTGNWKINNWEETSVTDELVGLQNEISDINSNLNNVKSTAKNLQNQITNVNSNLAIGTLFKCETTTASLTLSGYETKSIAVKPKAVNGYVPITIMGVAVANVYLELNEFYLSGINGAVVTCLYNRNSSSQTASITLRVLYVKSI